MRNEPHRANSVANFYSTQKLYSLYVKVRRSIGPNPLGAASRSIGIGILVQTNASIITVV